MSERLSGDPSHCSVPAAVGLQPLCCPHLVCIHIRCRLHPNERCHVQLPELLRQGIPQGQSQWSRILPPTLTLQAPGTHLIKWQLVLQP